MIGDTRSRLLLIGLSADIGSSRTIGMYLSHLHLSQFCKSRLSLSMFEGQKRDRSDIAKSGDFSACPYCQ